MSSWFSSKKVDPEEALKDVLSQLTEDELEKAALSDHKYYEMKKSGETGGDHRQHAIDAMAKRYLANNSWKAKKALAAMKDAIKFREEKKVNDARYCFYHNDGDELMVESQKTVRNFMGKKPRAILVDYDPEGRPNVMLVGRYHFVESKDDVDGMLMTYGYVFERACAAAARKSELLGKTGENEITKCNVLMDMKGFDPKTGAMTMSCLYELMKKTLLVYPERINNITIIDINSTGRFVLRLVKYGVEGSICNKFTFVNGDDERKEVLGDHYLVENMDKVEVEEFYQRPFDEAWFEDK